MGRGAGEAAQIARPSDLTYHPFRSAKQIRRAEPRATGAERKAAGQAAEAESPSRSSERSAGYQPKAGRIAECRAVIPACGAVRVSTEPVAGDAICRPGLGVARSVLISASFRGNTTASGRVAKGMETTPTQLASGR